MHLDITFGLQVVDSLVSVVFIEALNHPYISFFHLLVNGFSVTCNNNYHNHQLLQTGFLPVILKRTLRDLYHRYQLS